MVTYLSEVDALKEFVDGLKRSAACAHAMAHYQQNSHWFKIRDLLENMITQGQKLAISKSQPRQDLLDDIAKRAMNAPKDSDGN